MAAHRNLNRQLSQITQNPVQGFHVESAGDDLFNWQIYFAGPPETPFEGSVFQARMKFPHEFPFQPPSLQVTTPGFWHPNVYPDGRVCISILHPPGDDPSGYELASERWSPIQKVESILVSVLSMISAPNTDSPANVDAAKQYRSDRAAYDARIRQLVQQANRLLPRDFESASCPRPAGAVAAPPPEPYAAGMARLLDMGLGEDDDARRKALEATKGDADRAVELLLC